MLVYKNKPKETKIRIAPDVHEELKKMTCSRSFSDVVRQLLVENKELKAGFHEAINQPKGIVPADYDQFYDASY